MTTVLGSRPTFSSCAPQWRSPHQELWVSTANGEYRGMIEHINGRYVAANHRGTTVGEFKTLAQAQRAVDGWSPRISEAREVIILKTIAATALLCSTVMGISLIS
jgi:hypothetical protein